MKSLILVAKRWSRFYGTLIMWNLATGMTEGGVEQHWNLVTHWWKLQYIVRRATSPWSCTSYCRMMHWMQLWWASYYSIVYTLGSFLSLERDCIHNFSGFSVDFCINEEKVICYHLELGKLVTDNLLFELCIALPIVVCEYIGFVKCMIWVALFPGSCLGSFVSRLSSG